MGDLNTNFCRPNGHALPTAGAMVRRPQKMGGWVSLAKTAGCHLRWEAARLPGPGS